MAGGTYPQNIRVQDKAVRLYGGYVGGTAASYAGGTAGNFTVRDPAANPSHLKGDGKDSVVTLYESGASIVDGFLDHRRRTQCAGGAVVARRWVLYLRRLADDLEQCDREKPDVSPRPAGPGEARRRHLFHRRERLDPEQRHPQQRLGTRRRHLRPMAPKLVIRGNTVQNNIGVSDHGGGIYLFSPDAEISHNRVEGNEIGRELGYGWGGGIIVVNKGGNYKLSHNVFTGNFAPSVGSAVFVDEGAAASMDHDLVYANACNPAGNGAVPPVYVDGNEIGEGGRQELHPHREPRHDCRPHLRRRPSPATPSA